MVIARMRPTPGLLCTVELDVDLINFYDEQIRRLDLHLEQQAKIRDADPFLV